jgi:hypothetical protein
MIGFDSEEFEAFLNSNANGAAAPPESDDEVRPEPVAANIGRKLEGVSQKIVRGDKSLTHSVFLVFDSVESGAFIIPAVFATDRGLAWPNERRAMQKREKITLAPRLTPQKRACFVAVLAVRNAKGGSRRPASAGFAD